MSGMYRVCTEWKCDVSRLLLMCSFRDKTLAMARLKCLHNRFTSGEGRSKTLLTIRTSGLNDRCNVEMVMCTALRIAAETVHMGLKWTKVGQLIDAQH